MYSPKFSNAPVHFKKKHVKSSRICCEDSQGKSEWSLRVKAQSVYSCRHDGEGPWHLSLSSGVTDSCHVD